MDANELETFKAIGGHEARLTELERWRVGFEMRLDKRFDDLQSSISDIHDAVTGAKGSWRAIMWVASIASLVGAALIAVEHYFVK